MTLENRETLCVVPIRGRLHDPSLKIWSVSLIATMSISISDPVDFVPKTTTILVKLKSPTAFREHSSKASRIIFSKAIPSWVLSDSSALLIFPTGRMRASWTLREIDESHALKQIVADLVARFAIGFFSEDGTDLFDHLILFDENFKISTKLLFVRWPGTGIFLFKRAMRASARSARPT